MLPALATAPVSTTRVHALHPAHPSRTPLGSLCLSTTLQHEGARLPGAARHHWRHPICRSSLPARYSPITTPRHRPCRPSVA
eukprot:6389989-Amphidinium_carterae.1